MKPEQAFAVLVERVCAFHPAPVRFDEGELAGWPAKAVAPMKAAKLLVRAPGATTAICPGCEQACSMPVHTCAREGYHPSPFVVCDKRSDINRVAIPPERLLQWKCSAEALCHWIAGSLDIQRSKVAAPGPDLVAIGSFHGKKRSQMLLLAVGEEPAVRTAAGNATPLSHLVRFGQAGVEVDRSRVETLVDQSPAADRHYMPSVLKREVRKEETRARHEAWRREYRAMKSDHPGKSDSWIAQKIAKGPHGGGYTAETIRKNMK